MRILREVFERLKAEFLEECRKHGIRISEKDYQDAIGLTYAKVRRKWQLTLAVKDETGKRKSRTVGLVSDEEIAKRLTKLYSASKHLLRSITALQELPAR